MTHLQIPTSSTSTPLPENWVELLFERMLLDYGKKFTDQWGAADMDALIAHWSNELAGFRGAELDRGLAALATKDWPPTLPEFKRLCRPGVDPLRAYYEAVAGVQARFAGEHGTWSHPAIYWAAMPMAVELREQPYSFVKSRWEAALAQQLASSTWPEIPRPMLALTAPGQSTTSREEAVRILRSLQAASITSNRRHDADPKAWAKRILEREAAGYDVLPVQARDARAALAAEA